MYIIVFKLNKIYSMKQTNFVERKKKATVFYNQSLTRSRTCYGAKRFENGYIAYAEVAQVDVFDEKGSLIERGLEDVFYFASGESFAKKLGSGNEWVLRDAKRIDVACGVDVMVLTPRVGAIKGHEGLWSIYMLDKAGGLFNIFSVDSENVIHMTCHELEKDRCLLVINHGKGITLFGFDYNFEIEPMERKVDDYTFTHSGLLVVSEGNTLLGVNKNDNCSLVCAGAGGTLRVFDKDFKQIYKHATDIFSFKNGSYFILKDGVWSFYTQKGTYFGGLSSLEVCRCGAINGKESPAQEKSLSIGRYDDKYIMVIQGNQTVVTDGVRVVSTINTHFNDVAILM